MSENSNIIEQSERKNTTYWIIFLGILFVGANLRAPLTSVGSLISFIRDDLGLTNTTAGLITTLPLLAFALVSPFAPKLSEKFGMERTIFISLLILFIGIIIRSIYGTSFLFLGTAAIGIAIAIGNVLIPVIIKVNFPLRVGLVMGFYAVLMNIFGALGSGISVPVSEFRNLGWSGSLGIWAILTLIAIVLWLPQLKTSDRQKVKMADNETKENVTIWKSKLAWYITIFMGLQSLMFYTLVTWLPDILATHGYNPEAAGWMLFLMQAALIPVTFIIPIIAEKMKDQQLLGGLTASFFILGVFGVYLGNKAFIPIAIMMIGMACGSAFSICMMLFSLRTSTSIEAAKMSGMAQSFGYLLAAFGPTLFGAVHDLTGGWEMPLIILMGVGAIIFIVALLSGKDRVIEVK